MWKHRKAKDYFGSEDIQGRSRECISIDVVRNFLERLSLAEEWLLKNLLGDNYAVKAAAANVRILAKTDFDSKKYFGDLYVLQNVRSKKVSFRLYCPKQNKFIWSADIDSELRGYVDLKGNTHLLHLGELIYILKFPDKRERTLFRDNLNKFLFFAKAKNN